MRRNPSLTSLDLLARVGDMKHLLSMLAVETPPILPDLDLFSVRLKPGTDLIACKPRLAHLGERLGSAVRLCLPETCGMDVEAAFPGFAQVKVGSNRVWGKLDQLNWF